MSANVELRAMGQQHRAPGVSRLAAVALCASAFLPIPAFAVTDCTITATTAAFGIYDGASNNDTAVATISGSCSRGGPSDPDITSPTLWLSTGIGGVYSPWRQMALTTNPAKRLSYNLFTDAARTTVWGNGTGGSSAVAALTVLANGRFLNPPQTRNFTFTAYGRIPASSPAVNASYDPGDYQDTITVTLNF